MKQYQTYFRLVAVLTVSFVSTSLSVSAADRIPLPKPFLGIGYALPSVVDPGPPTMVTNDLGGQIFSLGKWTGTSEATASMVDGVVHAEGTETLEFEEGGSMTLFITGDFPSGFEGPVANGTFQITEGTGQFAGASGAGIFLGGPIIPIFGGVRLIGYYGGIVQAPVEE